MQSPDLNGELTSALLMNKHALVAAGTATFASVDLQDFIGSCKVTLNATSPVADGSTTLTVSLLDSADNTTFTALTSPTFAPVTGTLSAQSVSLDTRSVRRYLQAKHVVTGTTATFTTAVTLVGLKQVV